MRLTLRTMLAYLDGILEPDDAQDIGKKIEDSQYATSLFHRVRDVMRRLRLAAPSISERGPGLDANTVAEYLDNTLSPDRVPDFEKVCLESDIHLAEVASCHQVLAAVLGEPVEIDPESRQRMYQLPQVAAQAAAGREEGGAGASGDGASGDAALHMARPKPTVPEYLREPPKRRSLLTTAVLLLLAGCFAGVVLWSLGLLKPLGNLVRTGRWNPEVAAESTSLKTNQGPGTAAPATGKGESKTPSTPPATPTGQKAPSSPTTTEKATSVSAPGVKGGPAPLLGGAKPDQIPAAPVKEGVPGKEAPLAPLPGGIAKSDLKLPGPAVPPTPGPGINPAGPATKPEKPVPEPVVVERIGHFSSEDQVLLQYDAKVHDWLRVSTAEPLFTGQRVLAMPTYRDEIVLDAGIIVQMVGATQVQFLPGNPQALPSLEVAFGRLLLQPVAQGGRQLRLVVGGRSGILTLVDAGSIVAVEVAFYHSPGTNPETEATHVVADLYATHGAIRWEEKVENAPLRILAPARLALDALAPPRRNRSRTRTCRSGSSRSN